MGSKIDGVNKQMETSTNGMKTNACRMNNKMNANMTNEMKKIRGEMQSMGIGLQDKLKEKISTIRAEVNGLKESVKEVRSAVKAGEEDVKEKMVTVAKEMGEVKEGQNQLKEEIKKNTTAIKKLEGEQGKINKGLEVVKKECEKRHQDMTERV